MRFEDFRYLVDKDRSDREEIEDKVVHKIILNHFTLLAN